MKIYVISGGPGTGKTSVINELSKEFITFEEAARALGDNDPRFKGKSVNEINMKSFQDAIFDFQKKQIEELCKEKEKIIFSDRGVGDTIAYYKLSKLDVPKAVINFAESFRYSGIFILDFLDFYETDALRQEKKEKQKKIHNEIIKTYKKLGYKIIFVPFMSIKDRVRFVKEKVLSE